MGRSGLSEEELIEQAPASCQLTPHKLKRWRREGLIPRPDQIHVAGHRGSVAVYPSWTAGQVRTVCSLRKRERRLDELKFMLWWEGHWFQPEALRGSLEQLVRQSLDGLQVLRPPRAARFQAAERVAGKAIQEWMRTAILRLLRFRLRRDPSDLNSALFFVFLLVMGGEPAWDDMVGLEDLDELSTEQILTKALGAERLSEDVTRQTGEEMDLDVRDALGELRRIGLIPLQNLSRLVASATEEELALARDDVIFLGQELPLLVQVLEAGIGRDAFGLGAFRIHGRPGPDFPERMALLVPFSIAIRRSGEQETVENVDLLKGELRKLVPSAREFLARRKGGRRGSG